MQEPKKTMIFRLLFLENLKKGMGLEYFFSTRISTRVQPAINQQSTSHQPAINQDFNQSSTSNQPAINQPSTSNQPGFQPDFNQQSTSNQPAINQISTRIPYQVAAPMGVTIG